MSKQKQSKYYGFLCYSQEGKPLGWLYTTQSEREYNWTDKPEYFHWCKRWKTKKGAIQNFDWYNEQWQFKSKGGWLKIEEMPEEVIPENSQNSRSSQERWDAKHPEKVQKSKTKYDIKNPVWAFRPSHKLLEWLEQERWDDNHEKPETDAALLNRKLEKLRELEQQGF